MGNCLFGGGGGDVNEIVIKVVTSNGGIMEFYAPITVEFITDEFPGHGIFKSRDLFWNPLPHQEFLQPGEYYYLLPLCQLLHDENASSVIKVGHVRSSSFDHQHHQTMSSNLLAGAVAPYRMSFDSRGLFKRTQHADAFSDGGSNNNNNNRSGFWKVKLVISPQQLVEILSEEGRTQELIESVRTVAKCGINGSSSSSVSSSGFFSDQWSLVSTTTSSRNASSKKDFLLEF